MNYKKLFLTVIGVIVIITIVGLIPFISFINKTLQISLIKTLFSFDSLKKFNHQVNFVLLGIAGTSREGPNLSDSIIFANYNFVTNKLIIISIPRDLWSQTLKDKINSAYAYGEAKEKNGGLKLAKAEVSGVVGQPIQYAAVINFDRFKELIDFFGGIQVDVKNSFTDKQFPIEGKENDQCNGDLEYQCRFETIRFSKGLTLMDGNTVLKYIRSRNAEGSEGGDFAREIRQQNVILSLKKSIIDLIKQADISKYIKLYNLTNNIINRDITNQQAAIIIKNIVFNKKFGLESISLDQDFFITPQYSSLYDNKWVLIPKNQSYTDIHNYISCLLADKKGCLTIKE